MVRLGLVDFDTSHAVEFTKRINHVNIGEDQWVEGARVVAGVPGTSKLSPERIPQYTEEMRKMGVPLFEAPDELFDKIDAVLIESVDGSVHMERAMPFLERGMATFVDKPFACSTADARAMIELAERTHAPLFSSSSLRYAPEVIEARAHDGLGKLLGAATHGPAPLDATGRNPGLFHYGVHPVEMLYALLGPGCERLSCMKHESGEVATGYWGDGRIGTVRGLRAGAQDYGFTVFGEKSVATRGVGTQFIYRELLKRVIAMFESGKPPIAPRESLEIVAFMEAALASAGKDGAVVAISV